MLLVSVLANANEHSFSSNNVTFVTFLNRYAANLPITNLNDKFTF